MNEKTQIDKIAKNEIERLYAENAELDAENQDLAEEILTLKYHFASALGQLIQTKQDREHPFYP